MNKRESDEFMIAESRELSRGYLLIGTVLLVAFVGILLGFGRLSFFRYQSEVRFERQRELDRLMAARSGLSYLAGNFANADLVKTSYMKTDYNVMVRRAMPLYKSEFGAGEWIVAATGTARFDFEWPEAEAGQHARIDPGTGESDDDGVLMRASGLFDGWREATYGYRYWVKPQTVLEDDKSIRIDYYIFSADRLPVRVTPGAAGEPWIRLSKNYDDSTVSISYWSGRPEDTPESLGTWRQDKTQHGMGIQLSADRASMFEFIPERGGEYDFKGDVLKLPGEYDNHFGRVGIMMHIYPARSRAPQYLYLDHATYENAYDYSIQLEWESRGKLFKEVATYVHRAPGSGRGLRKVVSYDTHGTASRYDLRPVSGGE